MGMTEKEYSKYYREQKKAGNPAFQMRRPSTRGANLKNDYNEQGVSREHAAMRQGTYGTPSKRKHEYVVIAYTWNGDKVGIGIGHGREGVKQFKKEVRMHFPKTWLKYQQHDRTSGKSSDHFGRF